MEKNIQTIIQISLNGVNCYLMKRDEKFVLVDTGGHMFLDKEFTNRRDSLIEQLEKLGVNETNLELIILTHGDNDHVCNARYLKERYHTKIAMNKKDEWMVKNPEWTCYQVNAKYESFIFRLFFKVMNAKIQKLMKKVYSEFEPFEPDIYLKDGQSLKQYQFDGTIYECSGHTDGSIVILDSKGNLICGDLFGNNKKPATAINAKDFLELKKSAKKILEHPVKNVYPGHGEPFPVEELVTD